MKRYNITVNGKTYDVAVEEAGQGTAPVVTAAAPVSAPVATPAAAPAPVAAPAPAAAPVSVEGGTEVNAPMPGSVIDVKVKVGDTVENGSVIIVLEAMKMENDIVAPVAGKIASINVRKGDSLDSGELIAIIQ